MDSLEAPKVERRGRHRLTCQCEKCQSRKEAKAALQSQGQNQSAAVGSPADSILTNPVISTPPADGFAAAEAAIRKDSPELFEGVPETPPLEGTAPAEPGAPAAPAADNVSKCLANLTPEAAERWLQVPFNVAAAVMKDEELKLTPDERDMMSGAARVLLEKHLPDVLRKTDSPELTMLGAGLIVYGTRVLGKRWKQESEKKPQSEVTAPAAVGTVLHVKAAPQPVTTPKVSIGTVAFPA